MDISKFQLKRVNPFQGLIIDADTWQDAHNYHRNQQRLHVLAFHKTGIVSGLEVSANNPADTSVVITPGIAVDPEGNIIIVPQSQRYRLQTQNKGPVYLIIQFREIPEGPFQPPEGGQPTRILEAYRIQERDHLPSEPFVELARINFDPSQGPIKNSLNPSNPAVNEINLSFRQSAVKAVAESPVAQPHVVTPPPPPAPPAPPSAQPVAQPAPEKPVDPLETVVIGYLSLGDAGRNLHLTGLNNLVRSVNRERIFKTEIKSIDLKGPLAGYNLLYITGSGHFELTAEQQTVLANYLKSGGLIFGDGCAHTPGMSDSREAKEFGLSFNRCAGLLNCKLGIVQRNHPVLSADHIFAETPPGCEPGMLLEGGNMIYSGSDYGCAWNGGPPDQPLSREIIRSAFEIGSNILTYSRKSSSQ